ncbi:MAG TPA: LPS export ABC transporter ATP-binding protein [Firmicutes bacterium]|uniref:LPS export ABC transporter ATP-binding protein n=1 Tax=Candidatus Coatesbacteria bacterium 4484_99 TaxID=1970774 RepID=A0A1W9S1D9_9BACT|nr:MAG: LPS export ABC transporter ATP-binding protein [Candidatus Coatesbacteria bacterium 4484_99]RLC41104.1 MAG: LPS export ABC transporter ATP-binding protein [Candidatus Coatesbacteria bacterium]HDM43098.1 LPS export ABC transporter ATP-binding protein [Bacillota bacterium]RLC43816.1 MAG: LPS export ABC transporter ATP-binding protein [Candidatus Coatesbacteria bacterium]RLC45005.1 MAG: LPS export ABC transporter ATP-binding protein [Candidatus Coatesbacteria bacterium]
MAERKKRREQSKNRDVKPEDLLLKTQNLVKEYGRRRVVNEVSLTIRKGEVVGLLGPNGAGKTTTFYMVVGLIKPDSGRVFLGEEEITRYPMYKRARMGIGYLSQEPSIFRKLTVRENILAILQTLPLSKEEREKRLDALLQELSISHLRNKKAYTLSGGERRRVEITRALVIRPHFLLLDEPFAGIDPIAVEDIQSIISHLKKVGLGILITDHNVRETLEITDRSYIMYDGRILISGSAEELIKDEEARKIYLGERFRM